jgi:uncharacterized protein YprB with RNaseH-like and TPR domain
LKADAGFLLCVGIKPYKERPIILSLADVKLNDDPLLIDENLAVLVKKELCRYDYILGWNQLLFDMPFLNDRLMFAGHEQLPKFFQTDLMYLARMGKSTMTSSRLDWVARKLRVADEKTPLDINTWKTAEAEALQGFKSKKCFDRIVTHNRQDLLVTEQVYDILKPRICTIQKR